MQTIAIAGLDRPVSRLVFGCWGIASDFHWGERSADQSLAAIHAALEAGVDFFDTAAVYADGASEELLGRALAGRRHDVAIATKVRPDSMRAAQIVEQCEASLRRLGTDYLDLYQTHWITTTPLEESWSALVRLRQQGKVRAIGVCNLGVGQLAAAEAVARPAANQIPYNLLWRAIEFDILPYCREAGIGVLAYSPLMHGLLAGKYRTADETPDGRARSRHFRTTRPLARHGEEGCEAETFATLDALRTIARDIDRPLADVALAWVYQQPGVTAVIAGASSAEQVRAQVAAVEQPLPAEIVERLNDATAPLAETLGPNPDMWQGAATSRYR